MSFKLYFAGTQCKEGEQKIEELNCCRLLSYVNDKKHIRTRCEHNLEVFLDCGAYSAFTKGIQIDIDQYIDFINTHSDNLHPFASLDCIPKGRDTNEINAAAEQSWQNYLYMVDKLNKPNSLLPVFHYGEDFKYLKRILNHTPKIDYMAFGGLVFATTNERHKWISQAFDIIKNSNNPNIKVHAFGVTNLKILETYPFYSADSTSWIMTASNGNILSDYGVLVLSRKQQHCTNHISHYPREMQEQLKHEFESFGLDFNLAMDDYKQRIIWNICYLKKWADNYKYKPKTVKQNTLF